MKLINLVLVGIFLLLGCQRTMDVHSGGWKYVGTYTFDHCYYLERDGSCYTTIYFMENGKSFPVVTRRNYSESFEKGTLVLVYVADTRFDTNGRAFNYNVVKSPRY